MNKIKSCILVFFLALVGSSIYGQNHNLNKGYTHSKDYYEEIAFEFIKSKIIVPVKIEGKTYRFILDTGAPNVISETIFNQLNLPVLKTMNISDASRKKEHLKLVSVEKLQFGNILFEETATLVYDLESQPAFKCLNVDGILGSNMLRNSIIKIDPENQVVVLTDDKKKLALKRRESSKIKLLGTQSAPYVWIRLWGEEKGKEQVLIDTGMDGLYDISLKNYKTFEKEQIFHLVGESTGASSMGLFGDVPVESHLKLHLPILKINNSELENVMTTTVNDNNSRIGAELLNYGAMTIDFKNKRFYFHPFIKKINVEKPSFGYERTLKGNKLVVGYVWDEELKEKIKYGDEILEINGHKVTESEICGLISGDLNLDQKDVVKLKLKSDEKGIFELVIEKKLVSKKYASLSRS